MNYNISVGRKKITKFLYFTVNNSVYSQVFISIICLIAYYPVFSLDFQDKWDDQWVVINQYTEYGLSSSNLPHILFDFYHGQYAPINQLYYSTLYEIFGPSPFWFHFFSFIFHLLNGLLVYCLIKKILVLSKDFSVESIGIMSFLTALIFSIHPFLVEAVAWVSASKIVLYSFFYIAALITYLKFLETSKIKFYFFTIGLFIISFGAKEQAVVLPLCLYLLDYIYKKRLFTRKNLLEKLPFFTLSIIFGLLTIYSQAAYDQGLFSGSGGGYSLFQRVLFAFYAITEYFTKCILPVNLLYLYSFPNQPDQPVPFHFFFYPIAVLAVVILLFNFWKKKWVCFGISFFIIHLLLCLHLIPMARVAIVADRYVYISSIGIFFLISFFFDKARSLRSSDYYKAIKVIIVTYCFYLLIYANLRTKVWHDSETLKQELFELIEKKPE